MPSESFGCVALVDFLGIRSLSLNDSIQFLKKLSVIQKRIPEYQPEFVNEYGIAWSDIRLETMCFGDTIFLLWHFEETKGSPACIIAAAEQLKKLIYESFQLDLLVRGALSYGPFIKTKNTVLGPAISDAVGWYEQTRWIGIIGTPRASLIIDKVAAVHEYAKEDMYQHCVKFDVPVKGQRKLDLYAVSWPYAYFHKEDKSLIHPKVRFLDDLNRQPIPFGVEDIFSNTNDFFNCYNEKYHPLKRK